MRCRVDLAIPSKTAASSAPPSGSETRCRDGWISSIGDEAGVPNRRPERGVGGRHLRVGGDHVDPLGRQHRGDGDLPFGQPLGPGIAHAGDRPPRQVGASATEQGPGSRQREHATPVVGGQEPRTPAGPAAVLGPRARLVDVASW